MKLAPSILAADFTDLQQAIKLIEVARCEFVHFDVMDGNFVPNLTFGAAVISQCKQLTNTPFDVHLMVTNPAEYVDPMADAGVDVLSFHVEAEKYSPRLIRRIQERNMIASVAVNPQTSLTAIEDILPLLDNVLLMSVDPGFYGQEFIQTMFHKIEKLHAFREDHELLFTIQVDGGVN